MGNQLFRIARNSVDEALQAGGSSRQEALMKARNALSSAYANSTDAERAQLHSMQEELNQLQNSRS
ncbi:DUF3813 domain-containing protein [Metabacillus arenae]|uniref:DUF3813 domain-containing protein n=1 Tax=Metabacillus arenae TaxID=2771434 RepID=A0A926NFZ9_9BACI|nr:DUF3813 domain-containing protein [Metabacillus arenae]MBD1380576.1 DUF3813 domain-containing protein [Metabacillus arenae]